MEANLETIKEQLDQGDKIIAYIRCSLDVLIYRKTMRPGILAATQKNLIFCGDSFTRNGFTEVYQYKDISDITLKKGLMNKYILIKHKEEVIRFTHLTSDFVEDFVSIVKSQLS